MPRAKQTVCLAPDEAVTVEEWAINLCAHARIPLRHAVSLLALVRASGGDLEAKLTTAELTAEIGRVCRERGALAK